MPLYPERALLYIRALTPVHVGIGRVYAAHVDQPVQRDEYGYPSIWASSLKGAIKANIRRDSALKKCFGPDTDELGEATVRGYAQSNIVLADAKLVLMPARVLRGVYAYITSPLLLGNLGKYVEMKTRTEVRLSEDILKELKEGHALVSKRELVEGDKVVVNETVLKARVVEDVLEKLKLKEYLPSEVYSEVAERGLVVVPDVDNTSINIVNRSMFIQYRIRLYSNTKTVATGPWSEEYVPSNTVFASLILCSGRELTVRTSEGEQKVMCSIDSVRNYVENYVNVIFVGGKETIGRGLVKLYLM